MTADAVQARLSYERDVAALLGDWSTTYPEAYAGAYHPLDFEKETVVLWVGQVPETVREQASTQLPGLSFDTTAPLSVSGFAALAESTIVRLIEMGHRDVVVGPSYNDKSLEVAIRSDDAVAPGLEDTRSSVGSLIPDGVGYTVTEKAGPLLELYDYHGGTHLHPLNSSSGGCTSAFAVTRGSKKGLITAGHCDSTPRYEDPETGYLWTMTKEGMHVGAQGDVGWYSFSGTGSPRFYVSDGSNDTRLLTDMRRESEFSAGQVLCFYGRASNDHQCGDLDSWNLCLSLSGRYRCNMAKVNDVEGEDGDSGGPWHIGQVGVGVTAGGSGNHLYFTPVEAALDRFGLDLIFGD